jgi:tRNA threonylcarbamoyladenosine biosynthesis protein TsaB
VSPSFLAFDTATRVATVAVGSGDDVRCSAAHGIRSRHSEMLLPMVDFVLRGAGLSPRELAGVVVGAGPGSFTGLRVAAASAKAICRVAGVPLLAWPTPLAVALAAGTDGPVAVWLESRRGEVYAACYDVRAEDVAWKTLLEPTALPVGEALERCGVFDPGFTGDGVVAHAHRLAEAGVRVVPAHRQGAAALALLRLAARDAAAATVAEPARWQPEYLQPAPPEGAGAA